MPRDTHNKAAEHHENAAKSHRTAAEHHGRGEHAKGLDESERARSHSKTAHEHSEMAHGKSRSQKGVQLGEVAKAASSAFAVVGENSIEGTVLRLPHRSRCCVSRSMRSLGRLSWEVLPA
jgi:hypothetical protein